MPEKEKPEPTIEEVVDQLNMWWQECHAMGGQDYEPSAFQSLINKVQSGEISKQTALDEGWKIVQRKQDYH